MFTFIDGPQLAGKTTLLMKLGSLTQYYKFPFSEYTKKLDLQSNENLTGFQVGKDLATLYFISNLKPTTYYPAVVDRGPFSTIYYSILQGRMTTDQIKKFLEEIEKFNFFKYIFITPKNRPDSFVRDKEDGFDQLEASNSAEAIDYIKEIVRFYNIDISFFENDFRKSIHDNSLELYTKIIEPRRI